MWARLTFHRLPKTDAFSILRVTKRGIDPEQLYRNVTDMAFMLFIT